MLGCPSAFLSFIPLFIPSFLDTKFLDRSLAQPVQKKQPVAADKKPVHKLLQWNFSQQDALRVEYLQLVSIGFSEFGVAVGLESDLPAAAGRLTDADADSDSFFFFKLPGQGDYCSATRPSPMKTCA